MVKTLKKTKVVASAKKSVAGKAKTGANAAVAAEVSGDLIDMDQAIALLKTTRPTFYRWLRAGKIKSMKVGRQWRFYKTDIERFLQGEAPRVDVAGDLSGFSKAVIDLLKARDVKASATGSDELLDSAINNVLLLAMHERVSDIHIEPPSGDSDARARIRFRTDGAMHEKLRFDARLLPAVIDRFKTMAACNLTEKKRAQDGRIMLKIEGKEIDVRVNFLPVVFGEAATLRILRRDAVSFKLDQLPYAPQDLERIKQTLRVPWGMVLFTGPTGSGKTTSLYAALHEVNTPEQKVMTVEDPVEYLFPGMVQVAVNARENMTFPAVLRAVMRSDPDVVMVGEVRDRDTLEICAQLALTGHLVLSTLHTDEAASALRRLVDIGLDPFLVADAVKLVVSQRLIRSLCKHCSVETEISPEQNLEVAKLARESGLHWEALPKNFRKAVGCKECGFTGYRGRTVASETLAMSPAIGEALRQGAGVLELRRVAVQQGMTTLSTDALLRAVDGRTSLEEALRIRLQAG